MDWLRENHPIVLYCEAQGITLSGFAAVVGTNPTQVSYLINAQRRCSAQLAHQIHYKTAGRISMQELIDWGRVPPEPPETHCEQHG